MNDPTGRLLKNWILFPFNSGYSPKAGMTSFHRVGDLRYPGFVGVNFFCAS
jgi:hypothetical protein